MSSKRFMSALRCDVLKFISLPTAVLLGVCISTSNAGLTHRYSFTTDASDSVGGANLTPVNNLLTPITFTGGQAQLNNPNFSGPGAVENYLNAPAASVMPATGSMTVEEWFTFTGSGFFTEAYAFSDNAQDSNPPGQTNGQYLMHAISAPQPASPPGGPNTGGDHIAQALTGYQAGSETDAFSTTPNIGAVGGGYLDNGETFMAATVIDGTAGTLSFYLYDLSQGGVGGLQQTIPAIPLSSYSFTDLYLGRSPFLADNATSGQIDEFRIYDNAQSAAQIAADQAAGADTLVPEPSSIILGAVGLLGFGFAYARRVSVKTN